MSSRAEVLKALPVSLTQDSPDAQVAWDAILCGQDVSAEGSKALWPEAIVLPALCKWKASRHGGLLVIAERSVCDLLAEMPALKTTLLEMSSNKFGYLLLTPEEITKEKLQILGPEGGSVILVILHSKEQSTSSLRSSLQLLSAPSQVIIAVESWEESTRQLATEILGTAVAVSLVDGRPEKVSEKENKIEKEDEDAHLVAGFMVRNPKANIISRSEDQDFRAACRALIKAGTADVDAMPTQGTSSVDEMEDAEFRQGIAALMARHHVATRSKQSKPAGKSKGKKRVAEPPSPEAKRLAADWDDCSDSFDFGF